MAIEDLVVVIDETGIHAPTYPEILTEIQEAFKEIYGQDIYIENDSEDQQALALFTLCISNVFSSVIAAFNSFSPGTAKGAGLSSNVRINGMRRAVPTNSSVDLLIIGQVGVPIINGIASDEAGTVDWLLPALVNIPISGEIIVTAVAAQNGDIRAPANTITKIKTQQFGWQTVNNPDAASPGAPRELDPALRRRQARSTMLPSVTVLEGIAGALLALPGVTRVSAYENDTKVTNADGLPPNSIAMVVTGGDEGDIANIIRLKKTPGCYTFGDVEVIEYSGAAPETIRFFRPDIIDLKMRIEITALIGYTSEVGLHIKDAVAAYVNSLLDGEDVYYSRLYTPANLDNSAEGATYNITLLQVAKTADALGIANIVIPFYGRAFLDVANITLVVT